MSQNGNAPHDSQPSSPREGRAALLAIGTEVTSGQIKNGHATFMSQRLDDFGITPVLHLAVPDDETLMLEAFEFAAKHCDFLFVTGGLGPTRDDFTRDVIAKWTQRNLEFREDSWVELQERLKLRNVSVSPNHQKQCFFPSGASILKNEVGTAHGFFLEAHDCKIWVLPGPTPELRSIWSAHVEPQLGRIGQAPQFTVLKWRTLGLPESEVADLTEAALEGSGLQTGYRLTTPFVEVKAWIPRKWSKSQIDPWISRLEGAIGKFTLLRDERDQALEVLKKFENTSVTFVDRVTQGQLSERILSLIREKRKELKSKVQVLTVQTDFDSSQIESELVIELSPSRAPGQGHRWDLEMRDRSGSKTLTLNFESKAKVNPDRLGNVAIELALNHLLKQEEAPNEGPLH